MHADCERELFKLGVPVKTRHNEVAPSQYEIAPIFENANLATDHQQLIMEVMRKTRRQVRPASACCTRSRSPASTARASTTTGRWPPTPARTCSTPATPRTTTPSSWSSAWPSSAPSPSTRSCSASSVACAGNDHRLGANEAPPAIISIFLGDQLQDVIEQIERGEAEEPQAGRRSWSRRVGAAEAAPATPATATAPARSPSPATSSSSGRSARACRSRGPTRC